MIRWRNTSKPELEAEGDSQCTMELEPAGGAVRLSITHTIERDPSKLIAAVSGGWPKVLSNLKSLLETGAIALDEPYPPAAGERWSRPEADDWRALRWSVGTGPPRFQRS